MSVTDDIRNTLLAAIAASQVGSSRVTTKAIREVPLDISQIQPDFDIIVDKLFIGGEIESSSSDKSFVHFYGNKRRTYIFSFNVPDFYQVPNWPRDKQIRIIKGIWNNDPIGNIIIGNTGSQNSIILSGLGIFMAIYDYWYNEFAVYGKRCQDLTEQESAHLKSYTLPVTYLSGGNYGKYSRLYDRMMKDYTNV